MNIGLLVSELEDKDVKKICIGASQAARENNATLCIMPGKYLLSETKETDPFEYQYAALFDYATDFSFDVLIVDIDRIGKNVPILKKESFLKKFADVPLLTLTKQEGFTNVNSVETDKDQLYQLEYEAVCDAIYYADNKKLPNPQAAKTFNFVEKEASESLSTLAKISYPLLHRKYPTEKAYEVMAETVALEGIKSCSVMLYDKKIRNTIKYWWEKPEKITVKANLVNGIVSDFEDGDNKTKTSDIIQNITKGKPNVLVAGPLFVGEYQLGILVTEFTANILTDYFFETILSVITGVARVSYLEKELKKTNEELYEVQEELARDDSVLDHIGDQDYLTGGLNRRGFFAKAYDLLKEKFGPGKCAIVAYIHMESLKGINEMYGHEEGDRAVKRVSGILEEVFEDCIYGRIRGDEFAVLEISDEEGKAESFRQEMSTQNAKLLAESSRYMNYLKYSICEFGYEDNLSLREMLKETDENLQRIK
ncbi:GGDEF domain-containing protein [Butyrivibrio sp. VCB2006]|uniref:GGDEF domain-containing protein n=1 Tax=Butyrivibrio sp. VCB2006 TaxID=1280679 RepID=UPI0003FE7C7A|nr:GGDEF domain-containing protein [Butyrivibrio sp. VCB2006]